MSKNNEQLTFLEPIESEPDKHSLNDWISVFVLHQDRGMSIMEELGQPSLVPSPVHNYDAIPQPLKKYVLKEDGKK